MGQIARDSAQPVPGFRTLVQYDGKDFTGRRLEGLKIIDRVIKRARFDRAVLRGAIFDRSSFLDCSFVGAALDASRMHRTVLENCDFRNASLVKVDARDAVFRAAQVMSYLDNKDVSMKLEPVVTFDGATIENSTFAGARLNNTSMLNVRAANVDFREANLEGSRFEGCTIAGSNFSGAKLGGADFSQTEDAEAALPDWAKSVVVMHQILSRNDLLAAVGRHEEWLRSNGRSGARLVLRAADLSHARLDNRDLSGADLRQCRLDFASLQGGRLIAADLRGCSFVGAALANADLRHAQIESDALVRAKTDGIRS